MEEKKKTVKMKVAAEPKEEQPNLSQEQFKAIINQYSNENRYLKEKVNELMQVGFFKRLEFLFDVLKNYTLFDEDFVEKVVQDIQNAIYPNEDKDSESDETAGE